MAADNRRYSLRLRLPGLNDVTHRIRAIHSSQHRGEYGAIETSHAFYMADARSIGTIEDGFVALGMTSPL